MGTKNFVGEVVLPVNSEFGVGDKLSFQAYQTTGSVYRGAFSDVEIDETGQYDFTLQYGSYVVWYYNANRDKSVKLGVVTVDENTVSDNLHDLVVSHTPLTPDAILTLQGYLDEARGLADLLSASKDSLDGAYALLSGLLEEVTEARDEVVEISTTLAERLDAAEAAVITATEAATTASAAATEAAAKVQEVLDKANEVAAAVLTAQGHADDAYNHLQNVISLLDQIDTANETFTSLRDEMSGIYDSVVQAGVTATEQAELSAESAAEAGTYATRAEEAMETAEELDYNLTLLIYQGIA